MTGKSSMTIKVKWKEDKLYAVVHIHCPENGKKELSFIINNDFTIEDITADVPLVFAKTGEESPSFRSLSQRIKISADELVRDVFVTYSGTVQFDYGQEKNWHNFIGEDFVSLSFYSVWYPQDLSAEIALDQVIVEEGQKWFVVKGAYQEGDDTWTYGNQGFDPYNIVAYRKEKLQTISNPYMNIYFMDDSIKQQADKAQKLYREVIDYYNGNLFEKRNIPTLDISCASPYIKTGGGYRRRDFMW